MAGRPKRGTMAKAPPAPSFVPQQQFQQQQKVQQQTVQPQQKPQQQVVTPQPKVVPSPPKIVPSPQKVASPPQKAPPPPTPQVQSTPPQNNGKPAVQPMDDSIVLDEGEKKSSLFKKLFAGVRRKTTTRVKKMRQNRRLRRILLPKNALMALHEIQGIKMSDFVINPRVGGGFTAEVMVNNIQYEGSGPSKLSAKNSVCEKALRDLIISKMMQSPSKHGSNENLDGTEDTKMEDEEDVEMKDGDEEDDVPMTNLASYALYKLFSEWENEGFEVPEFRNHSSPNNNSQPNDKPKKPPTIRNELPPNWETMHPTTLLCMMRPGICYTELGAEGFAPNQIQKMGVSVDGEHFIGTGRSKKLARRDAACLACNKLFGTNFQKEE